MAVETFKASDGYRDLAVLTTMQAFGDLKEAKKAYPNLNLDLDRFDLGSLPFSINVAENASSSLILLDKPSASGGILSLCRYL